MPEPDQKFAFADYDGVIALPSFYSGQLASQARPDFVPELCARLASLLRNLQLQMVVSSEWRNISTLNGEHASWLERWIPRDEWRTLRARDWCTPTMRGFPRWMEIRTWMERHRVSPESVVILDDRMEEFETAPPELKARLVLCSSSHGLVPKIMAKVYEKFQKFGGPVLPDELQKCSDDDL